MTRLPTPRVELREVRDADLPLFFQWQSDPVAVALAVVASRDHDAFLAHWRGILTDGTTHANTVLADGEVVGNVLAFDRDGHREVGYWLDRDAWGRGIATLAVALLLKREPHRPLVAWVASTNPGSRRVLEKNGFRVKRVVPAEPDSGDPDEIQLVLR